MPLLKYSVSNNGVTFKFG